MRTLREGTQWEPSGRGLSENPQGGDSVRTLSEETQCWRAVKGPFFLAMNGTMT